jgi:hypothetical protein
VLFSAGFYGAMDDIAKNQVRRMHPLQRKTTSEEAVWVARELRDDF